MMDRELENGKENGKNSPQTGIATGMVLIISKSSFSHLYGKHIMVDAMRTGEFVRTFPSRIQYSRPKARFSLHQCRLHIFDP
jgi:hypothetical protein